VTEAKQATWSRFRGRLQARDLLALIFEDAAVIHPIPFDPNLMGADIHLDHLPNDLVQTWLDTLPNLDLRTPGADYILEQAQLLGLPTRMGRSDLHVIKQHQRVLELPGTGGQLAHHLVSTTPELSLQSNFTIACGTWKELALAGLVALDVGAPHADFVLSVETDGLQQSTHPLRQRTFDVVIGLHPDKGGLFQEANQLAIWFPAAKILLV
jgi:hypothetical protein